MIQPPIEKGCGARYDGSDAEHLSAPEALAVVGDEVFVADTGNARLLRLRVAPGAGLTFVKPRHATHYA